MRKGGRISSPEFEEGLAELDAYWREFFVLSVTDEAIRDASRAAIEHGLRAYDSLHLATALDFAKAGDVTFACWDRELRAAVGKYGFALIPEHV